MLQCFVVGVRSNVNCCKNSRVELGLCDSQIRNEKNKQPSHRKQCSLDHSKKESTIERRKTRKQRRNHLMGKDEKSDSKYETEKMKLKDHVEGKKFKRKEG